MSHFKYYKLLMLKYQMMSSVKDELNKMRCNTTSRSVCSCFIEKSTSDLIMACISAVSPSYPLYNYLIYLFNIPLSPTEGKLHENRHPISA